MPVLPHVIPRSVPYGITPSVFTSCKSSRQSLIGAICNLKVIFVHVCLCECVSVCVYVCFLVRVSACNLFLLSAGTVSTSTTSVQHRAYTAELSALSVPHSTGVMQSLPHTYRHNACSDRHICGCIQVPRIYTQMFLKCFNVSVFLFFLLFLFYIILFFLSTVFIFDLLSLSWRRDTWEKFFLM